MASDTRAQIENTDDVNNEYRRKITMVTPTNILGISGFESTFYASQILRRTLYNKDNKFTIYDKRDCILDLYKHVNLLHLARRDIPEPVGHILIGELDCIQNKYTLLSNLAEDCFEEFTVHNEVRNVVLIGANTAVRESVRPKIQNILDIINEQTLNHPNLHEYIAEECQKIFREQAVHYNGINDKLYCVHLSTLESKLSSAFYFLESDGTLYNIEPQQDGAEIIFTK
ncbi:hypothetical protein ACIG6B_28610 [Bacillus mobilis]|uniref:hypothetical protein n=2 Tax=Bacteria TaxID=2 RepID=UPI0036383C19